MNNRLRQIKRHKKGEWYFAKYWGDTAVYAQCNICTFRYPSYESRDKTYRVYPRKPSYNYCPHCGAKMGYDKDMKVYRQWHEDDDWLTIDNPYKENKQ